MAPLFAVHYAWWLLALALVIVELLVPGYFLLWIGLGAAATGLLVVALPSLSLLVQAVAFAAFALLSCLAYVRWLRSRLHASPGHAPLNRRAEQLIGQRYVLVEPIVNGRGKVQVRDGQWRVTGPDLPKGSTVEVLGVDGTALRVRAAS